MKLFGLGAFIAALACCSVNAGEVNVGLNGGYASASDMTKDDLYNAQLYTQYNFDGGLGIEGGYNVFSGGEVADKGVTTHGPYIAASLNADLGRNLDLYSRAGVMYAMQTGDVDSHQRFSPFLGLGAKFALTDNFYGKAGYDHYFELNDSNEVDTDADVFYAGLGFNF